MADVPNKRRVRFPARVRTAEGVADVEIDVIDTSRGAFDYDSLELGGVDFFEVIARDALATGIGQAVKILGAASHLFEAERASAVRRRVAGSPVQGCQAGAGSGLADGGRQPR